MPRLQKYIIFMTREKCDSVCVCSMATKVTARKTFSLTHKSFMPSLLYRHKEFSFTASDRAELNQTLYKTHQYQIIYRHPVLQKKEKNIL